MFTRPTHPPVVVNKVVCVFGGVQLDTQLFYLQISVCGFRFFVIHVTVTGHGHGVFILATSPCVLQLLSGPDLYLACSVV